MNNEHGFTLIELLVVMMILGLISGGVAVQFSSSLQYREVEKAKQYYTHMQKAAQVWMQDGREISWQRISLGELVYEDILSNDYCSSINNHSGNIKSCGGNAPGINELKAANTLEPFNNKLRASVGGYNNGQALVMFYGGVPDYAVSQLYNYFTKQKGKREAHVGYSGPEGSSNLNGNGFSIDVKSNCDIKQCLAILITQR